MLEFLRMWSCLDTVSNIAFFFSSLWVSASKAFEGMPLTLLLPYWNLVCKSKTIDMQV